MVLRISEGMAAAAFIVAVYTGKIGIDNFLLMLVGGLYFVLYFLKRKEGTWGRLRLELFNGCFFLIYGMIHDLYRVKFLRPYLLRDLNFLTYRVGILLIVVLPIYVQLINDIAAIVLRNYIERKKNEN